LACAKNVPFADSKKRKKEITKKRGGGKEGLERGMRASHTRETKKFVVKKGET